MDTRIILYIIAIIGYFAIGRKSRKNYIILMCGVFCLEAGLRHVAVGTDTYRFYLNFVEAKSLTWLDILNEFKYTYIDGTSKDPGYYIIKKLFHYVSDDWQLYLFSIAAFFFYALGRFIYYNTFKPIHVLFAFILYISLFHIIVLCVFRQAICMAISFLIFPLLLKKRWIPYVIFVMLSSTIHSSMPLMLLMIPLVYMNTRYKKIALMLSFLSVPLMAVFARVVIAYMASYMKNEYYSLYAESEGYGGAYVYFLLCALVAVYVFFNISQFNTWQKSIYVAGITLLTVFSPLIIVHGALIRISQYFAFYMMFAIPIALDRFSKSNLGYFLIILALIALSFRTEFTYYFFWESVPAYIYM